MYVSEFDIYRMCCVTYVWCFRCIHYDAKLCLIVVTPEPGPKPWSALARKCRPQARDVMLEKHNYVLTLQGGMSLFQVKILNMKEIYQHIC